MNILVCKRQDGGVTIISGATVEMAEKDAQNMKDSHGIISWRWMPISAIPEGEEFRDAWSDSTPDLVIDIDLDKARNIQLGRIRLERNALLKEYDTKALIAMEQSDQTSLGNIKIIKQRLRDCTEPLKALQPQSIEEIKNAYPDFDDLQDVTETMSTSTSSGSDSDSDSGTFEMVMSSYGGREE